MAKSISPTDSADRIRSLDILRGFAILGILIMNIQSFSMIEAAYLNPTVYGDFTGINKWIWILSHVFADNKFMSIFSMLFGAGIILMSFKIEDAGKKPAGFHYRRIFWLLLFGLVHAYLFWYGDILVAYAMCALLVYLFRKMKPGWLLFFGFLSMFTGFALYMFFGMTMEFWPEENIQSTMLFWSPAVEQIQSELNAYQGTWLEAFHQRVPMTVMMQTMVFLVNVSWHAGGLMLIGMAFFKLGILSASRSNRFYFISLISGLLIGLPLILIGIRQNFNHEWSFEYSMYFGSLFNYWGSLFVSYAYISMVMLLVRNKAIEWCLKNLANVGRSALSNYLLQTIICTSLFYGYGLGWYGKTDRWQLILIVIGVWIIQVLLTRVWMKQFRFGPAEWAWRSLTYWKVQSLKSL